MIHYYLRSKRMTKELALKELSDFSDKLHYDIPSNINFPRKMDKKVFNGMEIFEAPSARLSKKTLLYYHGGAWIHQFSPFHWKSIADIMDKTGCAVVAPNYPMLPKYAIREIMDAVMKHYEEFVKTHDMNEVVLGGDSAGGQIAISVMLQAKAKGLPLPSKAVLISPCVDVTGFNKERNKMDGMLEYDALNTYADALCRDIDKKDPLVSPYYGDLTGLPPIDLYVGTSEQLYDSIIKFHEKLLKANVNVSLHVGDKMDHVYPLFPMKRAQKERKLISNFIIG